MAERNRAWRQAQAERVKHKRPRQRRRQRRPRREDEPVITRLTFRTRAEYEAFRAWWKEVEGWE